MPYPTISEYIESIRYAEDNFATLTNLRSVLDNDGNPVMSSGNFAVVFKMKDIESGKLFALKCFTRYQEGRDQAYRQIADYLADVDVPWLLPVKYIEDELFVDTAQSVETEFPVLLMDWAEGTPLDVFIDNCRSSDNLQTLSYRFALMATWLLRQPFAHGDLKPDNILVNPTTFQPVLVDYDGMFVPAMNGQKARELGSPDYRHPRRTIDDFNEHIDDFALCTIHLYIDTIRISHKRNLTLKFQDYVYSQSELAKLLKPQLSQRTLRFIDDSSFASSYYRFIKCLNNYYLDYYDSKLWYDSIPNYNKRWIDSCGVEYSEYWKTLISAPRYVQSEYHINDRCLEIGNWAFDNRGYIYRKIASLLNMVTESFLDNGLKSISIPNSIVKIGDYAFYGCRGLTSVTIPNSVTEIGREAFYGCSGLTSVTIGNSVTEIGREAFYGCSGLTKVEISDLAAWCKITFRNNTANPLFYAKHLYLDGGEIKDLVIPNSVTSIGDWAFYGCSGLVSIVIPDSVTSIGERAFYGCSGLTSVTIPNSVTEIGREAFFNCSGLTKVEISDLAAWCKITFRNNTANPLFYAKHLYLDGGEIKDLVIPNSVTSIGERAFWDCSGLTSVTIPDSVTEIGDCAFYGCCGFVSIVIPDSVTKIGDYAFDGCSGLTSITIPDSVTEIGERAFDGCGGLRTITVAQCNTKYDSRNDCNTIIETASNTLIVGCKNTIIPDSVTEIGSSAFDDCRGLKSIVIPDSVTKIGDHAFYGCSCLTSVTIGNSVTKIGDYAFYGCGGLVSIVIPDSVTSIGEMAFSGCSGLVSIVIPDSVTEIGDYAFYGCGGLVSIVIPDSVTKIGGWAFRGCGGLTSIFIPRGSLKRFRKMLPYELRSILIEQ